MATTNDIYKGMIINYNNEPHVVVEKEFYKPGKGGSFTKTKMQNIRTTKYVNIVYKSGEKIDELEVQTKSMQFMYLEGTRAYFMDPQTFEQIDIPLESVPGGTDYLHESGNYIMTFYEGTVIYVQVPAKLTLNVTETPDAVKGDTATNAYKDAILETGVKVQVPLFIKNGDRIIINTETNSYYSKE
jgi:elongation factor P